MRLWWKKLPEAGRSDSQPGGRSFTLLIVPSAQSRVRKIVVRELFLRRAAAAAGIGALLLGLLLVDYARGLVRVAELKRLRAENAAQRVKAAQVALDVAELEDGMTRLRKLEGRLRTAFDLDRGLFKQEPRTGSGGKTSRESQAGIASGAANPESDMGIGGGEAIPESDTGIGGGETSEESDTGGGGETSRADVDDSLEARRSELVAQVDLDLELMKGRVVAQERDFSELVSFLEDRKLLLASTPSIIPVSGRVSSGFRRRNDPFTGNVVWHRGLDISTATGTPVLAPADGVVNFVGRNDDLGNVLSLDHGHGYLTRFGHNSRITVRAGQQVRRSQIIAYVGNTGRSTGPHLHYEIFRNGLPVNPQDYIIN